MKTHLDGVSEAAKGREVAAALTVRSCDHRNLLNFDKAAVRINSRRQTTWVAKGREDKCSGRAIHKGCSAVMSRMMPRWFRPYWRPSASLRPIALD